MKTVSLLQLERKNLFGLLKSNAFVCSLARYEKFHACSHVLKINTLSSNQ